MRLCKTKLPRFECRNRNRSRRVANENLSIPLLSGLILPLSSISARSIPSTSCCTFRSRAQPIFGDYSVSHLVSNLFSSRRASSKHTIREKENSLTRNRNSRNTHILSLPPTALFVSGVSTPPLVPRSMTLRREPEMAPGLEALEAC